MKLHISTFLPAYLLAHSSYTPVSPALYILLDRLQGLTLTVSFSLLFSYFPCSVVHTPDFWPTGIDENYILSLLAVFEFLLVPNSHYSDMLVFDWAASMIIESWLISYEILNSGGNKEGVMETEHSESESWAFCSPLRPRNLAKLTKQLSKQTLEQCLALSGRFTLFQNNVAKLWPGHTPLFPRNVTFLHPRWWRNVLETWVSQVHGTPVGAFIWTLASTLRSARWWLVSLFDIK